MANIRKNDVIEGKKITVIKSAQYCALPTHTRYTTVFNDSSSDDLPCKSPRCNCNHDVFDQNSERRKIYLNKYHDRAVEGLLEFEKGREKSRSKLNFVTSIQSLETTPYNWVNALKLLTYKLHKRERLYVSYVLKRHIEDMTVCQKKEESRVRWG